MTTILKRCHLGDVSDKRTLTLGGVDDLTAASSLRAHVYLREKDTTAELDVAILDANARTVELNLGDAGGWLPLRPHPGDWRVQVEVTFGDGTILTWPNDESPGSVILPVVEEFG